MMIIIKLIINLKIRLKFWNRLLKMINLILFYLLINF